MIPSRPLNLFEIIQETFRIFGRTLWRTLMLQVTFVVPCILLVLAGMTNITSSVGDVLSKNHRLDDSTVTAARNAVLVELDRKDPGTLEKMRRIFKESSVSWDAPLQAAHDTLSSSGSTVKNDTSITTSLSSPHRLDSTLRAAGLQIASRREAKETILDLLTSPAFVNGWLMFFIGATLLTVLINGALAGTVDLASRAFEERPHTLRRIWPSLWKRNIWMVLAYQVTVGLVVGVFPSFLRIPFSLHPNFITSLFSAFVTVVTLYFVLRLIVTIPAIVCEELDLVRAVKRSWELTRDQLWRIVGIVIFCAAIMLVLFGIIVFVFLLFDALSFLHFVHYVLFAPSVSISSIMHDVSRLIWIGGIAYIVPMIIISALQGIFSTVLYYDLRTRHDGPLTYDHDGLSPDMQVGSTIQVV